MAEQSACNIIPAIIDEHVEAYNDIVIGPSDVNPQVIATEDDSAGVEDVGSPDVATMKEEVDIGLTVLQPADIHFVQRPYNHDKKPHSTENQRRERDRAADRVSLRQQELMLNFMARHRALAKNILHGAGAHERARKLWNQLADTLNSVRNGSRKSGDRWRKYWTDWKFKLRTKCAEDRRLRLQTNGKPCKPSKIKKKDLQLLKILGKEHTESDQESHRATAPLSQQTPPPQYSPPELSPHPPDTASPFTSLEDLGLPQAAVNHIAVAEQSACNIIPAIIDEHVEAYNDIVIGPSDVNPQVIATEDDSAGVEDVGSPDVATMKEEVDIGLTVLQPADIHFVQRPYNRDKKPHCSTERDRVAERVSLRQQELMLNFMARHRALAKNILHGAGAHVRARKLWNQLVDTLNSVRNGSRKSGDRWRKYWTDWKCKVRTKWAEDRRLRIQTSGEPCKPSKIKKKDLLVLKILGKDHTESDQESRRATAPLSEDVLSPQQPGTTTPFTSQEDLGLPRAAVSPELRLREDSAPSPSPPPAYQRCRASRQHFPTKVYSGDRPRRQSNQDVEPDEPAWRRLMEEKRVESQLAAAQAARDNARSHARLVDLLGEHLPRIAAAFTRIADAIERAVPPAGSRGDTNGN